MSPPLSKTAPFTEPESQFEGSTKRVLPPLLLLEMSSLWTLLQTTSLFPTVRSPTLCVKIMPPTAPPEAPGSLAPLARPIKTKTPNLSVTQQGVKKISILNPDQPPSTPAQLPPAGHMTSTLSRDQSAPPGTSAPMNSITKTQSLPGISTKAMIPPTIWPILPSLTTSPCPAPLGKPTTCASPPIV